MAWTFPAGPLSAPAEPESLARNCVSRESKPLGYKLRCRCHAGPGSLGIMISSSESLTQWQAPRHADFTKPLSHGNFSEYIDYISDHAGVRPMTWTGRAWLTVNPHNGTAIVI